MSDNLVDLENAYYRAARDLDVFESDKRHERIERMRAATEQIDRELAEKYGARLEQLKQAKAAARSEWDKALIVAGQEEIKKYPKGILIEWAAPRNWRPYMGEAKKSPTGRRGRYELCTEESMFPANVSYRAPKLGSVFIRLLKKDGTPALGFERVDGWSASNFLPEGENPNDAEAAA